MIRSKQVRDFAEGVVGDSRTIQSEVGHLFNENAVINAVVEKEVGSCVMMDHLKNYLIAFPDLVMTKADYLETNNGIVMQFTCEGTHLETFYGLEAAQRRVVFHPIGVYTFDDNSKVIKYNFQVDLLDVMQQLGMRLSPTTKLPQLPNIQTKDMIMRQLQKLGMESEALSKNEVLSLLLAIKNRPILKTQKQYVESALLHLRCQTVKQAIELLKFISEAPKTRPFMAGINGAHKLARWQLLFFNILSNSVNAGTTTTSSEVTWRPKAFAPKSFLY